RLAQQRRVEQLLDRRVEGVEVGMQDRRRGSHGMMDTPWNKKRTTIGCCQAGCRGRMATSVDRLAGIDAPKPRLLEEAGKLARRYPAPVSVAAQKIDQHPRLKQRSGAAAGPP